MEARCRPAGQEPRTPGSRPLAHTPVHRWPGSPSSREARRPLPPRDCPPLGTAASNPTSQDTVLCRAGAGCVALGCCSTSRWSDPHPKVNEGPPGVPGRGTDSHSAWGVRVSVHTDPPLASWKMEASPKKAGPTAGWSVRQSFEQPRPNRTWKPAPPTGLGKKGS